ncbi:MAG TPA: DUF4350 domain-containing protein [Chloroflexia bacterium]|nr:DUF4350 domain-containing protein [Chloroflexia bacterium]
MSARRGDRLIVAALLVILFAVAVLSFLGDTARQGQEVLKGSSLNAAPPGTLALYRWLSEAGYVVTRLQGSGHFADTLQGTDLLFVLNPQSAFTGPQIDDLERWMDAGGVLVISLEGSAGALNPITERLGARLTPLLPAVTGALPPREPVWLRPPVRQVGVQTTWQIDMDAPDAVPLLSAGPAALVVSQARGQGRLVLFSTTWPFSNAGLRELDNRWLAWNLAGAAPGRRIAFDEVHHGYTGGDLRAVLLRQPWGWALIYALLVGVCGLVLTGRRLGPPLAPPALAVRRGTSEYVAALAALFHRAGRTDWVADRYRHELRQALARPYGLDPAASAADLAATFAAAHTRAVDVAALQALLLELDAAATPGPRGRPVLGEAALLRLVRRAEAMRSQISPSSY